MSKLFIHDDAKRDLLTTVKSHSIEAVAKIAALLEELAGDEDWLDRLTQHGFGKRGVDPFNISQWFEQQRQGNNLWRLKAWDLEEKGLEYRIIYAFIPTKHHYHVLGILPRKFNYETGQELTQRVLRAYEEL